MIHLTRQRSSYAPSCVVDEQLTIHPILPGGEHSQPALRWLGVWFDRRLTFRRHVATRTAKAARVAHHIRSLARTTYGPPASSLRKATIACVYPSLLYGTECWYRGRTKQPHTLKPGRPQEVSAYVGWHVAAIDKTLAIAARGILPAWKTTPTAVLFRDAGLLSAAAALEEAKLRFATHLRTIDADHPLTRRTLVHTVNRGVKTGQPQRVKTKVQQMASLLPEILRTTLTAPHYSTGCRIDPTLGIDKKAAAKAFNIWWAQLPPLDVTIFSDGSEQNRGNFINNFIEPAGLTENEEDEYEAWKRSEPIAGEGVDPIKYWVELRDRHPSLSKFAIDMLSIPGSSCECERLFSELGDLLEPRRRSISPQLLAAIQCDRRWIRAGFGSGEVPVKGVISDEEMDAKYANPSEPSELLASAQLAEQANWLSSLSLLIDICGEKRVTYGFAVYQNRKQLQTGRGSLSSTSHVFDAEAVGAWRGLQHTIRQSEFNTRRIWLCIDSTSVIWCLRGDAPPTSQWAFLECHGAMETHDVSIKWAPGHLGIEGNEAADRLADLEAQHPSPPTGQAALPTLSGIKTTVRNNQLSGS
ncbi:Dimer-Tnp-hAT domain containing protein [Pyrenophora tritici-repentis]|uniref:Dimer-Tnp-hAT domain containing protein n=4 Tax=Pyrenophora tritici-repentis TaxID=45151 RepID=A0A834RM07_9PLEO|nr:Dimer-Tnp-hAT domain containing protein [Pyrenophora tritici-repentis]